MRLVRLVQITCTTVGLPIPGVEGIVIDPETEEILPEGQIGELCTRGFVLFQGYVGDEQKTRDSYTKDGIWWKTGDLAVIEDGYTKYVIHTVYVNSTNM